eukprot:TRINITY_DN1019_c0_g1_i2.p3 TRINITY_DN1019_c0_g1~~TRINITY_DN1019_c0_g1_i2.p3  ORF type:complete len:101 (-),score=18.06 TRINITY_DN1019_c0_g1_i2:59-361(-)
MGRAQPLSDFVRSSETVEKVMERHQLMTRYILPLGVEAVTCRAADSVIKDKRGVWHRVRVDKCIAFIGQLRLPEEILFIVDEPSETAVDESKVPSPWCCG